MVDFKQRGFSLVEVMVVVISLGILAAISIPNYVKGVERSYRRVAQGNLQTIWTANKAYFASNQSYWPGVAAAQNLAAINTNLGLNIIANGFTYSCTWGSSASSATYTCTAIRLPATTYTLTMTEAALSGTNPSCTDGAAATCPN